MKHGGIQPFVDRTMTPGPDPAGADFGSFIFLEDPDGNALAVQHVNPR